MLGIEIHLSRYRWSWRELPRCVHLFWSRGRAHKGVYVGVLGWVLTRLWTRRAP
jgi:hypothetical protein